MCRHFRVILAIYGLLPGIECPLDGYAPHYDLTIDDVGIAQKCPDRDIGWIQYPGRGGSVAQYRPYMAYLSRSISYEAKIQGRLTKHGFSHICLDLAYYHITSYQYGHIFGLFERWSQMVRSWGPNLTSEITWDPVSYMVNTGWNRAK